MDHVELDNLIEDLRGIVEESEPQKGYWRNLWALVREIGAGFKGIRYPTREDREVAWSQYQELIAQAKQRSEDEKERSRITLESIQSMADSSRPASDDGGFDLFAIFLLPLTIAVAAVEAIFGATELDELNPIREELKKCNSQLQEAWRLFNERKHEMLPGDRQKAWESLQEAKQKIDEGWDQWKEKNTEIRERKNREWRERIEANIEKLEGQLDKARAALERQQSHLEDLNEKYSEARGDGYRSRVSQWIDECEEKIESIKESIDRLEQWLSDARDKLD
jgi:hypothetical protein